MWTTPSEMGELPYRLFSTGPKLSFSFHYAPVQDAADLRLLLKDVHTYTTTHSASLQHSPVCAYMRVRGLDDGLCSGGCFHCIIFTFFLSLGFTFARWQGQRAQMRSLAAQRITASQQRTCAVSSKRATGRLFESSSRAGTGSAQGGKASNATNYAHSGVQWNWKKKMNLPSSKTQLNSNDDRSGCRKN